MNLVDLLDEGGLKQDEWSLTAPTFGKEGQLTVVGWSGYYIEGKKRKKQYILFCKNCSKDSELFGDGFFSSRKSALVNGSQIPCGCSKKPEWSETQYYTLCIRKADEKGYKFLGFDSVWKRANTKIKMLCEKHGEWYTGTINNLVNNNQQCPSCAVEVRVSKLTDNNKYTDEAFIESFMSSGYYTSETRFERSDRLSKNGKRNYWLVHCGGCNTTGENLPQHIRQGRVSCSCMVGPTQAYVKLVRDSETVVALKFGISKDAKNRKHYGCAFEVTHLSTWQFPDRKSCVKAEAACKSSLLCRVLNKQEMPDGYTETTFTYNLDKIIEIYKEHGGVEI